MKTIMNDSQLKTLEQVERFLEGTSGIDIQLSNKSERYAWIETTLEQFVYQRLNRDERGIMLRYLGKVSGYSRQQVTRLVSQFLKTGHIIRRQRTTNGFHSRYTRADILLLAEMDKRHSDLSGPATKKLCERAFLLFGQKEYERLATISVSHLYNLRQHKIYIRHRKAFGKTTPVQNSIGERRKPRPQGKPGYIRIDTVHQGDLDGTKGVYHINAIDEITQFEIISSVEKITDRYLIPTLEAMLSQFPFVIKGFHADNGSEYINRQVAAMLNRLLITLTKSRPRNSNDNALVESKNGSVIRKLLGHMHIPQQYADLLNQFHNEHLNPYVNYHRPCFFPVTVTDSKGRQKRKYPYEKMMTPYERFKSLPKAKDHLRKGLSFEILDAIAFAINDNLAAEKMQAARKKLFKTIFEQKNRAA